MDVMLSDLVERDTPRLNSDLADGLATTHVTQAEKYIHQVFVSASKGFPEGLLYLGYARCTPQEEYNVVTKKKGAKQGARPTFDVARSDLFMVKYLFSYKGEELEPRYLYLPFVSDAGCITVSGSRFNISPVLADRVISIGTFNIFFRLLRDRLTFERMSQHFMIDGKRETVQVVWAPIYHKDAKMKKLKATVRANCSLVHYLFCKYGFTDTFVKFANCKPIIGGAEVNKNVYPESEWVICSSTQVKPKGVGRSFYEPSYVNVAVRKEDMTPLVKNMLGGFFYILDHFPARIKPEYVDNTRLWMVLLGHIIFSGAIAEGTLHDDIRDHISSLDNYLDTIVVNTLKDIGIVVEDIYQLFAIVIERFNDWLLSGTDKVSSMYDKELSILYFVLYDITKAIFTLHFKLKAASKKDLTAKEIVAKMNATLRTGLIYFITRQHREVTTVSSPGDNKAFKLTSILIPQSSLNKGSNKSVVVLDDPAHRLHVSVAEIGGYLNLPKSDPSGRARLNLTVDVDEKGVVLRSEKHRELLEGIQESIRR